MRIQNRVNNGEPFFVYKGLSLIADGYETLVVRLKIGDKEIVLEQEEAQIFRKAFKDAARWCKDGWCSGSC